MNVYSLSIRSFLAILCCVCLLTLGARSEATEGGREQLPGDTCLVELSLPEGAAVAIDGRDCGQRRSFQWSKLQPDQFYSVKLTVAFANGKAIEHTLLIEGGQRISLPVSSPDQGRPELVTQTGHGGEITSADFSPDGRQVVTGSADGTSILWDTANGRRLRTFAGDYPQISPNGRELVTQVTAEQTNDVLLWDLATGRRLQVMQGRPAAFGPGGRTILTIDNARAVLWEAASGRRLQTISGHPVTFPNEFLFWAALSPDGRQIATANTNLVIVWDVAGGQKLTTIQQDGWFDRGVFSQDGRQLITLDMDNGIVVWDVATGRQQRSVKIGGDGYDPNVLTFSADRRRVLIGSSVFDLSTGQELRKFELEMGPTAGAFSPDGRKVLAGLGNNTAFLLDTQSGEKLQRYGDPALDVYSLALGANDRLATCGHFTPAAILWDLAEGRVAQVFARDEAIGSIALASDGRQVLTGHSAKAVLWDTATGQELKSFYANSNVRSAAFSQDGGKCLTWRANFGATLWDLATGKELQDFQGTGERGQAAFSPDGRHVLTRDDMQISLWDSASGQKVRSFDCGTYRVPGWSAETGTYPDSFRCSCFSPDGKQLLTGHDSNRAILWDVASGRKLQTVSGHAGQSVTSSSAMSLGTVLAVAFSPNGRRFVTGSKDKTAIVWDVATGRPLRSLVGHTHQINAVLFSRDGRRVLTGSSDGTVRIWDLATGRELVRLLSLDRGRDWLAVTADGLFDGSAGGRERVNFRVGEGLTVVPVDRFFQDFYRPGLLAAIWRGEGPVPETELGKQMPPLVRIVSPNSGETVTHSELALEVELTDQGSGIKGPWLMHNGSRVLAAGTSERQDHVLRRRFAVTLVPGENRFEVRAASSDGSWESEPAVLVVRHETPLVKPDLYLLAVGVNRYARETMNLKFAADDARALAALFDRRGPWLYEQVHSVTLLDEQATRPAIRAALAQMAGQARPQDTLVVFLAGHGTMVGQRYYFITCEFQQGTGSLEDDLRQQGLPADELAEQLAAVPALKRMLILDTCQSGGAVAVSRGGRNPFAFRGAIERLSRRRASLPSRPLRPTRSPRRSRTSSTAC